MRQDQQHHFAALGPIRPGVNRLAKVALDHAEDGFDLPALTIGSLVEVRTHQLPIFAAARLRCSSGTAMLRGNDAFDPTLVAGITVIRFAVVAGVGEDMADGADIERRLSCFFELSDIHTRAARGQGTEDHMVLTIAHDAQFGPTPIRGVFVRAKLF